MRYTILGSLMMGCLMLMVWGFINIQPCQYEDSSNCYWDAKTMGNGQGRSFVDIGGHPFHF